MKNTVQFSLLAAVILFLTTGCQEKPEAHFSSNITDPVVGEIIAFTNLTSDAHSYLWDFGDGTTSEEYQPTHAFNGVGSYTVKLTAFSENGNKSDEATEIISVGELTNAFLYEGVKYDIKQAISFYYDSNQNGDYGLTFSSEVILTCNNCIQANFYVLAYAHMWTSSLTEIPTGTYSFGQSNQEGTFSWGMFSPDCDCNPDNSVIYECISGTVSVTSKGEQAYEFIFDYGLENDKQFKLHYDGDLDFHAHNYGDVCSK
jgi:PKD repeat protein